MQSVLLDLTRRYCEPHRYYHTIEHVANLLHLGRDLNLSDEQVMAIWFHDAIYDVNSATNEDDSADLASTQLRAAGWPEHRGELVRQIVLDTKPHRPSIPESEAVVDLDLSPLAAPAAIYALNGENLRREHGHLSDADYDAGLRAFLESFLARDRIFWTPWGQPLEARARSNMQRALAALPNPRD